MHPNPAFAWTDRPAMLDFIGRWPFATIAVPMPGVVHAPVTVADDALLFHIARRNRVAEAIDGQRVALSFLGRHGYQSANWYVSDGQVPTWHYEAVEVEGVARTLGRAELADQVDALVAAMEATYVPDRPWTRDGLKPGAFDTMLNAIVGFAVPIEAIRGTRKFNQHKTDADAAATVAGLRAAGMGDVAEAVLEMRA